MFTEKEVEISLELSRLKSLTEQFKNRPRVGDYFLSNKSPAPNIAADLGNSIFLLKENDPELQFKTWLPSFDDLLEIARNQNITFSQITDFIHRRRFAEGREREGLLTLLFELNRAKRN